MSSVYSSEQKPDGSQQRTDQIISARFTLVERRLLEAGAAAHGILLGHYVRELLLKEIDKLYGKRTLA